ncbi:site-2 protease family protein [Crocosphaera sp.]|uniref:site-2 protease family protein n=1 Tax=Crocosphaera sp. TaxID=2729996 RepID=UPI002612A4AB|nr:site-2 protease family protein [Crocosphaera sp.]MDJ0579728.1 site-2 protease family protein [Crocosphaera sp.]
MLNTPETTTILVIILVAFGLLAWGYNRAKGYGKLGKLAWLQSVSLMAPWLVFFGLFAVGIYLNIVGILFLLLASIILYIYLGKKLRTEGQDVMLREKAAKRIEEEEAKKAENKTPSLNTGFDDNSKDKNMSDIIPVPDEDLLLIKGIFSIDTFFATETISYQEGAIFKGNLRGETEESYQKLSDKLKATFGEKYRLFLVEGSEGKPVVIILPSSDDPQPTTLVQKNLALVLFVATLFTTLEAASILLGFDLINNWNRYLDTLPIGLALWGIFISHEIGHRIVAKRYNIKMSVPFFLPTWQIGSFGAITRFESLIPTRNALFDVALAGPACGGILSLILLMSGLVLSHEGSLFQVPTQFFQSSILVGSLAKVVLGEQLQNAIVDVHPLTVVGWLGLVVTALNLMPAGQLDGGRIIQAIYGRKTARRTTIVTLVILGIVTIFSPANPIPLYWAVVILFLQRDLERPSLNELTEPDDTRAGWGLLALFLMLATLIPLSPALAGRLGIGG